MIDIAILNGGKSKRMGKDKAFLELYDGCSILNFILEKIEKIPHNRHFFAGKKVDGAYIPAYFDEIPDSGSLGGIYTAIKNSFSDYVFCLPVDMPFFSTLLMQYMIDLSKYGYDVIIPAYDGFYEPLFAIYSKRLEKKLYTFLNSRRSKKIIDFIAECENIKAIEKTQLEMFGNLEHMFINMNTKKDYEKVCSLLRAAKR